MSTKKSSLVKTRASASKKNGRAERNNNSENNNDENSLLEKFFIEQLKDMYYAEKKIVASLPEMEEACTTEELKEALSDHRHISQRHVKRLEKAFSLLNHEAEEKTCEAIDGILEECKSIIEETKEGSMTRDAALIIGAQKVEHYEIATYGGLVQLAITMGKKDVAELLDKTLIEEDQADHSLTYIAKVFINIEAEEEGKYSWNKTQDKNARYKSVVEME